MIMPDLAPEDKLETGHQKNTAPNQSAHEIHEKIIEQAQAKILQAKSAQEIKKLIKQNDPFGLDTDPYDFQEALSRLVSRHIMRQFKQEEITRIESIPSRIFSTKLEGAPYIYNSNRSIEVSKLASKMDDDITRSIVLAAAKRHDPFTINQFERHFNFPDRSVEVSIFNAVYKLLDNNPGISATDKLKERNSCFDETVEKIFDSVLPKIRQDRNMSDFNFENEEIKNKSSEIETARKERTDDFEYNTLDDVIKKFYPHLKYAHVDEGYSLYPEQIEPEYRHDTKKLFVNLNSDIQAGDGGWIPMNPEHEKQYRELSDDWDKMARGGGEKEQKNFEEKWIEPGRKHLEDLQVREDLKRLSTIIETGKSQTIQNEKIGDVLFDKGHLGKDGYGLLHIIESRDEKDKLDEDKMTALLYKVMDAAKKGYSTDSITIKKKGDDERIGLEKDGIIAIISRRKETQEKFVITGYEINNKKEEAAEAIQTVIARYGYTPEFSDFRRQVGAVVSSLHKVSPQLDNKSREIETARKAGYVQGVCECVAVIGDDHALGKKLLTEMKVTKDMAKKYANPETFKTLEQGIFAPINRQTPEQTQSGGHTI